MLSCFYSQCKDERSDMAKSNTRVTVDILDQECSEDHTLNETTKKTLAKVKTRQGLKKADTVEELFKKLAQ